MAGTGVKQALKDSLIYAPSYVIPQVVGLVSLPVYTRIFLPGDYGYLVLVQVTIGFALILSSAWIQTSLMRFYARYEASKERSTLTRVCLICLGASLATWLSVGLVGISFFHQRISPLLGRLFMLGMAQLGLDTCFNIGLTFFRVALRARMYTIFVVMRSIGRFLAAIVLIFFWSRDVATVLWGGIAVSLTLLPLMILCMPRRIWFGEGGRVGFHNIREFVLFGLPLIGSGLAWQGLNLADRYLVELFRGSYEVGLYSTGYNIGLSSVYGVFSLIGFASYPIIVATYEQQGRSAAQELMQRLSRYFFLLCIPAVAGVSVLAPDIMKVFTGSAYFAGYSVIPLVALGMLFNGALTFATKPFVLLKRSGLYALLVFLGVALNVLLNVFAIPKMGYFGAGLVTAISYGGVFLAFVIVSKHALDFAYRVSLGPVCRAVGASIVMSVCLTVTKAILPLGFIRLLILCLGGALIYLVVLLLMGEMDREVTYIEKLFRHVGRAKLLDGV